MKIAVFRKSFHELISVQVIKSVILIYCEYSVRKIEMEHCLRISEA